MIGLSSEVSYLRQDGCLSHQLSRLTFEAKLLYADFIDKLEKQKSKYEWPAVGHRNMAQVKFVLSIE